MKIKDLIEIENEQIVLLRKRSTEGDNDAARVLLEHLRYVSENIAKWKKEKDRQEQKQ